MQYNITSEEFINDEISLKFVENLKQSGIFDGDTVLYYEYPLFKEIDEAVIFPSFTIISKNHGVIIINVGELSKRGLLEFDITAAKEKLSQIYGQFYSKFIKYPTLKRSINSLKFEIFPVLYLFNNVENDEEKDLIVINNFDDFKTFISSNINKIDDMVYNEILSIIEGTKVLPKQKKRNTQSNTTIKAYFLEKLEKEMALFDERQKIAALIQKEGPQRIRGLAGSGKTVVLALKAALIHLRNPNAKILYTFYTKSLYDHIKLLVTRFYRHYEAHDPNWDNLHIKHAWGGVNLPGVYYETCISNGISPIRYQDACNISTKPFPYVCLNLLEQTKGILKKSYDYVLLDEGQDFDPPFYWICRKITKNDCLVWAYDELQNILKVKMQNTMTLFENVYGDKGIDLEKLQLSNTWQVNDVVLNKCYRNPSEILIVAHAVGFGIYSKNIVQMLENEAHWKDLGYEVNGKIEIGKNIKIFRPEANNSFTISKSQTKEEIIKCYTGTDMTDEINWICRNINSDIQEDKLLPEDIMIICLDDRLARKYFKEISFKLYESKILTHNILDSYQGDTFIIENCITLTTVYRAKGNETAMVYVIGVDSFTEYLKDYVSERNKLFTAFTRSKGWLRISGANESMKFLVDEINLALAHHPYLEFIYPNPEDIKMLRRELSDPNQAQNRKLKILIENLEKSGISTDEAIDLLMKKNK